MSSDLLHISDLHVRLEGKHILRGVTAGLGRGRITAMIGANGSGKTTLLKAILKEVPYSGRIEFRCGHDHSLPLPNHIGYVPQKLQIDARLPLTVRDLMALALQTRPLFLGIGRKTRATIQSLLETVGAGELLDHPVEKISGGELQRVLLALALHPQPELLLLDEPAAGVDIKGQDKFYDLIAGLNQRTGVTVVLVSHEMNVVSRHAHHVLCLKDGHVQCQGTPQEILTGEMMAQTFGVDKDLYVHRH